LKIPDFELERYFARFEFTTPFQLSASDVESLGVGELLELADREAHALWAGLRLGYTESQGHPALRAAIASLYERVEAEEVLVFSGAQEAIFAFHSVALGAGDHAVVTWPAYQSLFEVARAAGAEVTLLPLRPEDGWAFHPEALRAALRETTRVVVLNFPHNPTGALPTRSAFEDAVAAAEERGAWLFSDEVYRWSEQDEADRLPAAVDVSPRGVSLGVMSKSFGLPGLRIGWVATRDRGLMGRLAAYKDYITICASAPSEVLALIALRARDRILPRNRALLASNLARLDRFFARRPEAFEWIRPRAGSVAFPRLRVDRPIELFTTRLREAEGVLLLPGDVFGYWGNHFRIGFGRRSFPEALERLARFVDREMAGASEGGGRP
jgi:aspartate/methionine/tyrosine aminotransferase